MKGGRCLSSGMASSQTSKIRISIRSSLIDQQLSKSMLKNYTNIVALKISGDSMKGDLIMDGDIIILDCNNISTNDIKSGDIVAARVDNDYATLKRMFINKNKIELRPSNKLYSSIFTDKKNVKIDGKVVGLVRNY